MKISEKLVAEYEDTTAETGNPPTEFRLTQEEVDALKLEFEGEVLIPYPEEKGIRILRFLGVPIKTVSILDRFKSSDCWDARYDLPTCPKLNNPFLYCALSFKTADYYTDDDLGRIVAVYAANCHDYDSNQYYRWPDKGGGTFSHDEAIGLSFMSSIHAMFILKALSKHWGFLDNEQPENPRWKTYIPRFVWAMAYLRKRAGWRLWPWHRIGFALYLIGQALGHRDDVHAGQDGLLMSWLMRDAMREVFGCRLAWRFWEYRMRNVGPKWCFERYLCEYPVFRECAPERFT